MNYSNHINGLYDIEFAKDLSRDVLSANIITLRPLDPYTWASGIKSPIYADHRQTLALQKVRRKIAQGFALMIRKHFPGAEAIAGVSTAGIPHAILVAELLDLPMLYVRDKPKDHGKENLIEGKLEKGQKVVVIEDLISTGGSSLRVVENLRKAEAEVLGLGAIFTYNFTKAEKAFEEADCPYYTLNNYETLLPIAVEMGKIQEEDIPTLTEWYKNPAAWKN